jgi:hypothetical protein
MSQPPSMEQLPRLILQPPRRELHSDDFDAKMDAFYQQLVNYSVLDPMVQIPLDPSLPVGTQNVQYVDMSHNKPLLALFEWAQKNASEKRCPVVESTPNASQ